MPELTPNLGIKKPLGNENVSRHSLNENWGIIDEQVATKDNFQSHASNTTTHITEAERSTWNAKETTTGAQAKADTAEESARKYTDSQVSAIQLTANNITIDDVNGHFNSEDVEGALSELFQSVSDGKEAIATAIIDVDNTKDSSGSDTFFELSNDIKTIKKSIAVHHEEQFPTLMFDSLIWSYDGHTDRVRGINVDTTGYVYTSGYDQTLHKLTPDGRHIWTYSGHTDIVKAIAIDDDGYVYSGGFDNTMHKISPSGSQIWIYAEHTWVVDCIEFDQEGYIYTASSDGTIHKVTPNGSQVWTYSQDLFRVKSLALDTEGYIYAGDWNQSVQKISPNATQIWVYTEHTSPVYGIDVDAEGYVYSGSWDKTVHKITPNGTKVWSWGGAETNGTIDNIKVDQDGYIYAVGLGIETAPTELVHKISPNGTKLWSYTGHTEAVWAIAVDADGFVYTGSDDLMVHKISGMYRVSI
ncbi:WD40 repeat domain-containing protein [Chengkuizengella sp. SCS-71B]|uniref:WD40 repeat domain-containing protein n=1 Tax=Chengkuizengella sp. SCS-71B TaxID=3115290 RepID=UPI0032C24038